MKGVAKIIPTMKQPRATFCVSALSYLLSGVLLYRAVVVRHQLIRSAPRDFAPKTTCLSLG